MSDPTPRRRLVIVGALQGTLSDNRVGGQAFACSSLMSSRLSDRFAFDAIDSSIDSIQSKPGLARLPSALSRVAQLAWHLLRRRPRPACLVFCSHGLSFLEKGVMTLLARAMGAPVMLFPRSGHLVGQVERIPAFAAFSRLVLRSASVVVCQGAWWEDYFRKLSTGRGRFVVVENWLPEDAFVPPEAPVSGSGSSHFVVGYFNRIEPAKGIFDFLAAVSEAAGRLPGLRAVIYGDGSGVEAMKQWIADHRLEAIVEYRGWLHGDDKREELRRLDAYLFASHAEGFPNSLLEVLALKVPVVSVRVGAVGNVLSHGHSALLTDIGDIDGLATSLVALGEDRDLRHRLAEAAYNRVRMRNRVETAVSAIEELLP
jgi:glycosyltransferase involved in cell wall biosynthesis